MGGGARTDDGDDARAAAACLAGDPEAFARIVARHQDRVYGLALRWTGRPADAADLAQEAFLRAFAALARYDGRRPFLPWLMRIAVNVCRDWHRRDRLRRPVDDPRVWDALPAPDAGPPDAAEAEERRRAVRRAVAGLPTEYRLLVVLAYDEGMPLRDIAAAVGLPATVVKNRLFRARRRMAAALSGYGTGQAADPGPAAPAARRRAPG